MNRGNPVTMKGLRPLLAVVVGALLVYGGWRAYGGAGVAIALTGLFTWVLLYLTRVIRVLQRAAVRPKGYVDSAVMLNAKLKPKVNLLQVMAMTNSLGEPLSPEGVQPEMFRWTDEGGSHVTCEFDDGKLVKWVLARPNGPEQAQVSAPAASTGS